MNWDQLEGKWRQLKGQARVKWGKLTDDDLEMAGGHKDKLIGLIQKRYGVAKEQATLEADEWIGSVEASGKDSNDRARQKEPRVRHSAR